jgi:ribosomal protein L5
MHRHFTQAQQKSRQREASMQIATTQTPSFRISNRNTSAFKIRRNHHKTQHITSLFLTTT